MARDYNILIDSLPKELIVDNEKFIIDSDFRASILFEMLMSDNSLSNRDKLNGMLDLYFKKNIPKNINTAVEEIIKFYICGDNKPIYKKSNSKISRAIYDFDYDAPYIYAAFLQEYKIDLNDIDYIHWWKFSAMFKGLGENTEIKKIMQIRATDVSKIKDKEKKANIMKQQALYRIPENLTPEEKAARIGAVFDKVTK